MIGSDRHAHRGCRASDWGQDSAKKKPGGEPGEFFACYKRNKLLVERSKQS